jgi:hypothetical protein
MARDMNVSDWTVRNVVNNKLGSRSLSRMQRFLLTDRLKALRLQRSKNILAILKKKTPIILFSDEKYFSVDQKFNSRTDRFITKKKVKDVADSIKSIQKSKHPAQVMMFGLVSSNGLKMPPVFLKSGFRMGAKEYLNRILIPHVLPWIKANFPNNNNVIFMQDGAPCHTAKLVQEWLSDNLKFWSKEIWPPSSPDLNPLDFSIWAFVQARACNHQHPNLESLRVSVPCRSPTSRTSAPNSGQGLRLSSRLREDTSTKTCKTDPFSKFIIEIFLYQAPFWKKIK